MPLSDITKAKIGAANRGRVHTVEARARMAAAHLKDAGSRFAHFIERDLASGCVNWIGSIGDVGYGSFSVTEPNGRHRSVLAHRWSYIQRYGEVPDGLQLDHLCRNRRCVNTDHLEAVTAGENQRRGFSVSGLNSRKTHCLRGHPFDQVNTYMTPNGRRQCRTCRNMHPAKLRDREEATA